MLTRTGYPPIRMLRPLPFQGAKAVKRLPAPQGQVADETRTIGFTFSVIALAAPLVRPQGELCMARYLAFRSLFPLQASEDAKIAHLFELAAKEALPADKVVARVMRLFPARTDLYRDVVLRLLQLAQMHGAADAGEQAYIMQIAACFGLDRSACRRLSASLHKPRDAYAVLGLTRGAGRKAVKAAYARLMKQYHPDCLQAMGASAEMIVQMSAHLAEMHDAYRQLMRPRVSLMRRVHDEIRRMVQQWLHDLVPCQPVAGVSR